MACSYAATFTNQTPWITEYFIKPWCFASYTELKMEWSYPVCFVETIHFFCSKTAHSVAPWSYLSGTSIHVLKSCAFLHIGNSGKPVCSWLSAIQFPRIIHTAVFHTATASLKAHAFCDKENNVRLENEIGAWSCVAWSHLANDNFNAHFRYHCTILTVLELLST